LELNIFEFEYGPSRRDFHFFLASDLHSDERGVFDEDLFREQYNGDIMNWFTIRHPYFTQGRSIGRVDAYVNALVKEAFETLKPYVEYIDLIGVGNHETALLRYQHYDAVLMLVGMLNAVRKNTIFIEITDRGSRLKLPGV